MKTRRVALPFSRHHYDGAVRAGAGVGALVSEANAQRLSVGILVTAGAIGTLMVLKGALVSGVFVMGAGLAMGAVVEGIGGDGA